MRNTLTLLATIAALAACSDGKIATDSNGFDASFSSNVGLGPDVNQDLAALRRVTAAFHDFKTAPRAGWKTEITPCMTDPGGAGGMGFHYGNTDLIDGTASVEKPQLL